MTVISDSGAPIELNTCYQEDCFLTFSRMADNSVDFVFTSPPYNRKRNDKYDHYDDTIKKYFEFLCRVADESMRVSRKHAFINLQKNFYNTQEVYKFFGKYYAKIVEAFVWEKSNPLPAAGTSITNAFEYILCMGDTTLKSNRTYTKNHLTTSVARMLPEHKAMMHEDVAFFFIDRFTKPGDVVYDPFMGTGTTGKICGKLGRNWIGSEISGEYCKLTDKRMKE